MAKKMTEQFELQYICMYIYLLKCHESVQKGLLHNVLAIPFFKISINDQNIKKKLLSSNVHFTHQLWIKLRPLQMSCTTEQCNPPHPEQSPSMLNIQSWEFMMPLMESVTTISFSSQRNPSKKFREPRRHLLWWATANNQRRTLRKKFP